MPIAKCFPVGAVDFPSAVGIGLKVPALIPEADVHEPEPKRMGCSLILMSGANTTSL
jgi:hypothetical protein